MNRFDGGLTSVHSKELAGAPRTSVFSLLPAHCLLFFILSSEYIIGDACGQGHFDRWRLLSNARAFDDGNVAINRKVSEGLDAAARLRPANFQPVDLCSRANTQDFAGIMRGKVAASTYF